GGRAVDRHSPALPLEQRSGAAPETRAHAPFAPLRVDVGALPLERATTSAHGPDLGTLGWRRVFCADRTDTTGAVIGVAEFGPGETLLAHRHPPAEYYFGLSGQGTVTIDGVPHDLRAGVALFIPGDAVHDTVAGPDGLRFVYVFPRDRMSDVAYDFVPHPPVTDSL
ncbi:MAG: cupin domain-containing protein, partial [Primorskyibacter sp.]